MVMRAGISALFVASTIASQAQEVIEYLQVVRATERPARCTRLRSSMSGSGITTKPIASGVST